MPATDTAIIPARGLPPSPSRGRARRLALDLHDRPWAIVCRILASNVLFREKSALFSASPVGDPA